MPPVSREALRTERYLDNLLAAGERRAGGAPTDVETDREVRTAAAALSAGLVRVHPSFRFEEALAGRLAEAALRLRAGLSVDGPASSRAAVTPVVAAFPGAVAAAAAVTAPALAGSWPSAIFRRLPEMAARQSKPLVIGGFGVASAALSLGAFYVAWRHTHAASGRMGRAARTAHGRAVQSGRRRPGIVEETIGVVS